MSPGRTRTTRDGSPPRKTRPPRLSAADRRPHQHRPPMGDGHRRRARCQHRPRPFHEAGVRARRRVVARVKHDGLGPRRLRPSIGDGVADRRPRRRRSRPRRPPAASSPRTATYQQLSCMILLSAPAGPAARGRSRSAGGPRRARRRPWLAALSLVFVWFWAGRRLPRSRGGIEPASATCSSASSALQPRGWAL